MLGVLQLVPPSEAKLIFQELKRVIKPSGRILVVAIPDSNNKKQFLDSYLQGVQGATHLSSEQKDQIMTRHEKGHWYDFDELARWWEQLGGRCTRHLPAEIETDKSPRFHLEVAFSA